MPPSEQYFSFTAGTLRRLAALSFCTPPQLRRSNPRPETARPAVSEPFTHDYPAESGSDGELSYFY